MRQTTHPFWNIVLPAVLLFPLLLLMVGCLYIPTFEHVDIGRANRDFRPLVTGNQKDDAIVAGKINRRELVALLGEPAAQSENHQAAYYYLTTNQGLWVAPECFAAEWADRKVYVLYVRYDADANLTKVITFAQAASSGFGYPMDFQQPTLKSAIENTIVKINRDNDISDDDNWLRFCDRPLKHLSN